MTYLVDTLQPTNYKSLEIKLVGDAQIERHVKRVVHRSERPCRSAAIERLQDRGFNFQVVALVEELPDGARHPCARQEQRPYFRVDCKVRIPLPIPLLRIGETGMTNDLAADFFLFPKRERTERLREELYPVDPNCRLTSLRPEQGPVHADDVA